MKKILCLFSALALTLGSCSKTDDNSNATALVLPKTITRTSPLYPVENLTSTITYDGNKIVSISDTRGKTVFVYTDNVITQQTNYIGSATNAGAIYDQIFYTYANGKLSTVTTERKESISKEVYVYNSNGTVQTETYFTDKKTGVETKSNHERLYTYANGNLVRIGSSSGNTEEYEYDNKHNVFKNILGFKLLNQVRIAYMSNNVSSLNNVKKESIVILTGSTVTYSRNDDVKFDYNTKGYPVKKTVYNKDGVISDIYDYTY